MWKEKTLFEKVALGMMAAGAVAVLIIIAGVYFGSRSTWSTNAGSADSCPVESYRSRTEAIMNGLNPVLASPELTDGAWVADTLTQVQALRRQAEAFSAADCLALKHETFLFTFRHLEETLESAQAGDLVEMNQSLDLALINQARYRDWSVDIER